MALACEKWRRKTAGKRVHETVDQNVKPCVTDIKPRAHAARGRVALRRLLDARRVGFDH